MLNNTFTSSIGLLRAVGGDDALMSIEDQIKSGRVKKENFLGAVLDHENKQFRVYTNDMLINRYARDSVNVAKSFDKLCEAQMKKISELYSKSVYYIGDGFVRSVENSDEIGVECGKLLMNAMQTITASVELLRNGYILQPGMLLRSIVETFSLISYILLESTAFNEFKGGKIDINSTIKYGKKVFPPLELLSRGTFLRRGKQKIAGRKMRPVSGYKPFWGWVV